MHMSACRFHHRHFHCGLKT